LFKITKVTKITKNDRKKTLFGVHFALTRWENKRSPKPFPRIRKKERKGKGRGEKEKRGKK